VIAFGRGGVTDIIAQNGRSIPTGILFDRQDKESVVDALERFDLIQDDITPEACRANALRFSRSRFRAEIRHIVEDALG
jgi:glycosyltransferase involved in cell wall biosynthesis